MDPIWLYNPDEDNEPEWDGEHDPMDEKPDFQEPSFEAWRGDDDGEDEDEIPEAWEDGDYDMEYAESRLNEMLARFPLIVSTLVHSVDPNEKDNTDVLFLHRQLHLAAADIRQSFNESLVPRKGAINLERGQRGLARIHQCIHSIQKLREEFILTGLTGRRLFYLTLRVRDEAVFWLEELRQL